MKSTSLYFVLAFVALCLFQVSVAHFSFGDIGHDLHKDLDHIEHDVDDAGHDVAHDVDSLGHDVDDAGHDVVHDVDGLGYDVDDAGHDVAHDANRASQSIDHAAHVVSKAAKSPEGRKVIKTAETVGQIAGAVADAHALL
ncbi:hypothetical protein ACFFRR_000346 [Megaselia abdita]